MSGKDKDKDSRKRKEPDVLTTRTGGAYIPPAKLRMMQKDIQDKSSAEYQRLAWEQLKKSINGLINKVNTSNVTTIVRELIKQNLIRGRGLLCRSIMQAQSASQTFTNVYAALVAIINSKFPNIGELLLRRLVIQFRRGYKRNDKPTCLAAARFIAHLVNQQVAHEVLGLEILTLLLEHPTEDSVEVAIAFLKEIGARLEEVSPRGAHAIFERLRHVLHEGHLEKRVQYMIEVMFQVRKDKFKDFPTVPEELDLVEEEDQFTHLLTLDEVTEGQDILNVFKVDEEYVANEDKYATLRKEILDDSGDEESGAEGEDEGEDEEEDEEEEGKETIIDKTETNLLALRRTIYLTIQSSLDYEECCHKLLKMNMKEGQEVELCHMILDCCAQQRTYEKFFGLLAQRFCTINRKYVEPFQQIFKDTYDTVHRLDTNKLRNVAKFFAHLLFTDSIGWLVFGHIHLTEEETTSSSRIFIKILMQELSEYMGLQKLNQRLQDPTLAPFFEGLFPRDHPKNTRFSINFFTSIGLGGLTDELREFLKKQPKPTAVIAPQRTESPEQDLSGSSSSSSSSDSSSSSSSGSSSSSSSSGSSSDSSSSSSDSSSDSDSSSSSVSDSDEDKKKKKKKKASSSSKSKSKGGLKDKKREPEKPSKRKKSRSRSPLLLDNRRGKEDKENRTDLRQSRKEDSSRDAYDDRRIRTEQAEKEQDDRRRGYWEQEPHGSHKSPSVDRGKKDKKRSRRSEDREENVRDLRKSRKDDSSRDAYDDRRLRTEQAEKGRYDRQRGYEKPEGRSLDSRKSPGLERSKKDKKRSRRSEDREETPRDLRQTRKEDSSRDTYADRRIRTEQAEKERDDRQRGYWEQEPHGSRKSPSLDRGRKDKKRSRRSEDQVDTKRELRRSTSSDRGRKDKKRSKRSEDWEETERELRRSTSSDRVRIDKKRSRQTEDRGETLRDLRRSISSDRGRKDKKRSRQSEDQQESLRDSRRSTSSDRGKKDKKRSRRSEDQGATERDSRRSTSSDRGKKDKKRSGRSEDRVEILRDSRRSTSSDRGIKVKKWARRSEEREERRRQPRRSSPERREKDNKRMPDEKVKDSRESLNLDRGRKDKRRPRRSEEQEDRIRDKDRRRSLSP